ncbi:MAG: hypothetical protein R3B82_01660 [Sandaracinaceae bacterium]
MGEGAEKPAFEKGDRAAIVAGRKNPVGIRGQIFWVGENKYGDGMRYGLRGDDGETYWCDQSHLGPEDAAPPPPEGSTGPKEAIDKGARVSITKGPSAGVEGEVFWVGESRYGPGMRYGIRDEAGETHWADSHQVEALAAPAPKPAAAPRPAPAAASSSSSGPPMDDAPMPDGDDFAEADDFYGDDVPFPGDDIPF